MVVICRSDNIVSLVLFLQSGDDKLSSISVRKKSNYFQCTKENDKVFSTKLFLIARIAASFLRLEKLLDITQIAPRNILPARYQS
jgi:hypothetical protein